MIKKSLNDFFILSNYLYYNFGVEAPQLNNKLFINKLLRGDRIRIMNKSIK